MSNWKPKIGKAERSEEMINSNAGMIVKSLLVSLMLVFTQATIAQQIVGEELQLQELQKNVDIFAGILEDSLDLNQSAAPFSRSLSGVDSSYLYSQGVVLKLRTDLANRRSRMGFASLNSAMQALQARRMPFGPLPVPELTAESSNLNTSLLVEPQQESIQAGEFYSSMMDRIANIDYSLIVNNAIQQASNSARSLRALEGVDDSNYQLIRDQLEGLRDEMVQGQQELRVFLDELKAANQEAAQNIDPSSSSGVEFTLDSMYSKLEPLKNRAIAMAGDLRQRAENAEVEYTARWQDELLQFEDRLYQAMCDYGSTIRELPDDELISVILSGLGEESEENRLTDKVHVLSKSDINACQSGDIDIATLRARSLQYTY